MKSYALEQPKGYYVVAVAKGHDDEDYCALCRPNDTVVRRFDPAATFDFEIALEALEDHSELLTLEDERTCAEAIRRDCA
jgi:hypothetical protein